MHACHSVPRRKWNKAETNSYERTIEKFSVSTASSPTAGVCLSQQLVLLLVSSRKRSKISDAALTENFSGSCRSSFLLVPNYPKQKLLTKNHFRTTIHSGIISKRSQYEFGILTCLECTLFKMFLNNIQQNLSGF